MPATLLAKLRKVPQMRPGAVLLTMALVGLLLVTSGCLSDDEEKEVRVDIEVVGETEQNVIQGQNTTFLFAIENKLNRNATLTVSLAKSPKDWPAELLNESFVVAKKAGKGVRLNVSVPEDAKQRGYEFKVAVKTQGTDHRKARTVTVFVLDSTVSPELDVVEDGMTVYFNYTGFLHSNGFYFDTTNEDLALDNRIDHTEDFTGRASYGPAPFHIGQGELVPGFEGPILGMRQGETRSFFVPEGLAYSRYEEVTVNLTEYVPMREQWSAQEFKRAFREDPAMWMVVTHRKWNWTAQVVSIADDGANTVTIELQVAPGDTTETYGWESEVVAVDTTADGGVGRITLEHRPGEVGDEAQLYNSTAPKEYDYGRVTEQGPDTVTVRVQRSHHALAGEDLIFVVKVDSFSTG